MHRVINATSYTRVKMHHFLILMCQEDKGLIPRLCEGLCNEMDERKSNSAVSFCTEVR